MVTRIVDDLTGEEIAGDDHVRLRFRVDDIDYELDLSVASADRFREAVRPFIERARASAPNSPRGTGVGDTTDPGVVRAWLRENGYDVKERGKIPKGLMERYTRRVSA